MLPFKKTYKPLPPKNGVRLVYDIRVNNDAHYGVYDFDDFVVIERFIIGAMRHSISPEYYRKKLEYMDTSTLEYYEKRYRIEIDTIIIEDFIDTFNNSEPSPYPFIERLQYSGPNLVLNGTEEATLAGAIYLKNQSKMRACGHNAHAYRINTLKKLLYENVDRHNQDMGYCEHFWIFAEYIKDTFCQERTYAKKK